MTCSLLSPGAAASPFAAPLSAARAWLAMLVAMATTGEAQESRLANLAIRAEASAGEPLIVGFNVGPGAEKMVLIRAVGPTLGSFGVSGSRAQRPRPRGVESALQ